MDFIAMAETLEAQAASLRRFAATIEAEGQGSLPLEHDDGWRPWRGGDQPLDTYGRNVDIVMRAGERPGDTMPAAAVCWGWYSDRGEPDPGDVVEYRISAEQPES